MEALGVVGDVAMRLLLAVVGAAVGVAVERRRNVIKARADLLKSVEEWLAQAEKVLGIVGDRMVAVREGMALPQTYSLEDQRQSARYMQENSNKITGILRSGALNTWRTRRLAGRLRELVEQLETLLKVAVLPWDVKLSERAARWELAEPELRQLLEYHVAAAEILREAHGIVARLKTTWI